ncbi:MAG: ZIP family metal transporter [Candidatus Bathyarchaeia archaeon]
MLEWVLALTSVILVSAISLIGVLTLLVNTKKLKKALLYLVSFSAGGLLGDAFIHLIPEAIEENGVGLPVSIAIIFGILASFSVERFLQWRHCHIPTSKEHVHSFVYMNIFGDSVHNLIDGLIIGGSYLVSIPIGVATTLAVIFHEIPQELGDFGVLIYGGFSRKKALGYNFATALTAIVGVLVALTIGTLSEGCVPLLVPFAAGNFIYIAGSDLIPEIRKDEPQPKKAALQAFTIVLGVLTMVALTLLE